MRATGVVVLVVQQHEFVTTWIQDTIGEKNRKSELLEAANNAGVAVEASWTKAAILEALNGG